MSIKIMFCTNVKALEQGEQVQCAIQGTKGLELAFLCKDTNGVIRRVINTSTKSAYTKVQMYNNSASALNLTEKETKELMAKRIITVYRSSGATNDKGETLTREEQINKGVARAITIEAQLINDKEPNATSSYVCNILSDTGASFKLEGEYTL